MKISKIGSKVEVEDSLKVNIVLGSTIRVHILVEEYLCVSQREKT